MVSMVEKATTDNCPTSTGQARREMRAALRRQLTLETAAVTAGVTAGWGAPLTA
jgi:hypothetical protein